MNTTTFDPEAFLSANVDEPLSTEFRLCPEGEYEMSIGDFDGTAVQVFDFTYKQGPQAGEPGTMTKLTVPCLIQDDKVKADLGRNTVIVSKQMILDMREGRIDTSPDKNTELGRLREAVGQNVKGQPWNVLNLRHSTKFLGRVAHREIELRDGSKRKIAEVTRVVKL